MKLKSVLATSAAAGALLGASAAHADHAYISVFGGWSSSDSDVSVGSFSASATATTTATRQFQGDGSKSFGPPTFSDTYDVSDPFALTIDYYSRQTFSSLVTAEGFIDEADSGFVVGGAVGMDFDDGWRFELEAAYRAFDIGERHVLAGYQSVGSYTYVRYSIAGYVQNVGDTYTTADPYVITGSRSGGTGTAITANANSDGDLTSFSLMANVWYDYQLGNSPVSLIFGGGLGAAKLDLDYHARVTLPANTLGSYTFPSVTTSTRRTADDWVFAWQAGAGLGYEFDGGMMLSAQYRYFSAGDIEVMGQDVGLSSHEALIGLSIPLGN